MVKIKNIIIITLFLVSTPAISRVVSSIDIQAVGEHYSGRNDKYEEKVCKAFRPSKKQLIRYLNLATDSDDNGPLLHDYYSPCIAYGLVKFKDGTSARWTLEANGGAYVTFSDKKQHLFFYRDNHWFNPLPCEHGNGIDEPKDIC
ncbi:hypothetical protein [Erwinia aphidicola]|uniref:Uncharacterized protein n=1 Tax=Erwinia aphidicola TaxID=68334 RepID=A0ABU8DK47_ERWAP